MNGLETFGGYLLLKRLGRGGMGDVHLARAPETGNLVVLKLLHSELSSDEMAVRRFRHEATLATFVESRHLARIFDAGMIEGQLFIAMEYIEGWPLARIIEELTRHRERPPISAAIAVMEGALEGLVDLHRARHPVSRDPLRIIHRDISPKNIMVGEDGRSRLIDLGIGRSNARDWKTGTGRIVGTPGYMPPEQAWAHEVDHRADLYSIGVVLFELLTLSWYIERGPIAQVLHASLTPQVRSVSSFRSDVPPALERALRKAVALKPEDRFQSAEEMLAALRKAVPARRPDEAAVLLDDLLWRELDAKKTAISNLVHDTYLLATTTGAPMPDTVRTAPISSPRRSTPAIVGVAATLVGIGIGVGAGRVVIGEQEPVQAAPPPALVPPAPPAIASPRPEPIVELEAPPKPPPAPPPPKRSRRRAANPPPAVVPVAEPAKPVVPEELLTRAKALSKRWAGTARGGEAERLMMRISLQMPSKEEIDWRPIAREVEQLEKQ